MKLHDGKYLHGEAFCLMNYASDDGKTKEVLWNSRDGVTPFCLGSVDGVEMQHVNWQDDTRSTLHVPEVGSRMFIDCTKARMLEFKRTMVERAWDDEKYPLKDYDGMAARGKDGAALWLAYQEWQDGQPDVVVVTQEILDKLIRDRMRRLKEMQRCSPPRAG
jgi:hypothetical protein